MSKLHDLFPLDYKRHTLSKICLLAENLLFDVLKGKDLARVPGRYDNEKYSSIIKNNSIFPYKGIKLDKVLKDIISNFLCGTPVWRSPNLQYNIGSPVNVISSAISAIAQDINIYNINTGLSGNSLAAERAVSNILCNLAGINRNKGIGIFTFGGTATNLYAMKIAINKSYPEASRTGVPNNIKFLITEDAHFSHSVAANWLGIGTNNLITIPALNNRTSDTEAAEKLMESVIKKGNILSGMILNGGTTYDHAIDDIHTFCLLRNKLVKKYHLKYKPHIHIDSVIGWIWLVFSNYNFASNPLNLDLITLGKIYAQYQRLSKIKEADSWGVDFHKGIGGCPIPCSVFMSNNKSDLLFLSKKNNMLIETHQVIPELSIDSISDYTLETSRSGAAPLAALSALRSLGKQGYQQYLASLINSSTFFRQKISNNGGFVVANPISDGFVTMLIIIPPELMDKFGNNNLLEGILNSSIELTNKLNSYMKCFFKWDSQTRTEKKLTCVYSYSSSYIKTKKGVVISALKFYPVSPFFDIKHVNQTIKCLINQKQIFDRNFWNNH